MALACFWLEPSGVIRRSLRRYRASDDGRKCPGPDAYHDARVPFSATPDTGGMYGPAPGETPPERDPRWPRRCAYCPYVFRPSDAYQLFCEREYTDVRSGRTYGLRAAPVGAMYRATWLEGEPSVERVRPGPDGMVLIVRTPGGDWCLDARSAQGTFWSRTGTPPHLTVTPSILTGTYHGWLREGVLIDA